MVFPLLVGFLLVNSLGPWNGSPGNKLLSKLLLGAGLGIGASSCVTFLGLILLPPAAYWQFLIEGILGCALLIFLVFTSFQILRSPEVRNPAPERKGLSHAAIYVVLLASLGFAFATFWHIASQRPHGGWDAWAIWNMRARFLYRGGEYWRDAFSIIGWSHPDYPLLLPSSVVRVWRYMGSESTAGPTFLAGVFTFGTLAVLVWSLDILVGRPQGGLAGLVLLSQYLFVQWGASQYADVPLGFYILLANVILRLPSNSGRRFGNAALAGVSTGFAAWAKNEGMLFIVAMGISLVVLRGFQGERKNGLQRIAGFLAGLVPVAGVIAIFKIGLAPPGDIINAQTVGFIWQKLSDWERIETVLRSLGGVVASNYPAFLFLLIYAYLVGAGTGRERRIGVVEVLTSLSVMLIGYSLVYVITPRPLQQHIDTSLRRLLVQLWPTLVLAIFLFLNRPYPWEVATIRPHPLDIVPVDDGPILPGSLPS
jgi:hypothetical protein